MDIQRFNRNFKNNVEQKHIQLFQNEYDMVQRQFSLEKIHKWKDFRTRRDQAMDRYIKTKKKIYKLSTLIKFAALTKITYQLNNKFKQQREFLRIQALKKFAYIKSALLYKRRLKKFGPSYVYDKYHSQIRSSFSLVGTSALK